MGEAQQQSGADWWRQAVVYQVYPRSFADDDGDGVGDLAGITSRVPYLQALGVDAVWISPFYPSALADGGYDVDHYRDVHPQLGTLADFDVMTARLHEAGIRVIVDIVPNHTSDRHAWFREALASPSGSAARGRYLFRDGVEDGPPSDWESRFGGSAWEPVGDGQWYLHSYAPEQPDLDWTNDEVRQDFLRTLRFWADRGVDGFRVDVAHALAKDVPETDLPPSAELDKAAVGSHALWDRDEVHDIYAGWRAVFDEYDPPRAAIAEAWVPAERRWRYARPEGLGQAFNFDLLRSEFDAAEFRDVITTNLALAARTASSSTWVLSNHDVIRAVSRYALPGLASQDAGQAWLLAGGRLTADELALGRRRALAASLLTLALPGSVYLYQGEELGLPEVVEIPDEQRQDPVFPRTAGRWPGRDGCRVPLPWTATGPSFGFGAGGSHLPQPRWFEDFAVDTQDGDPGSALSTYRKAVRLRREHAADEHLEWLVVDSPDVLAFRRASGLTSWTNFGSSPYRGVVGERLLASRDQEGDLLAGDATVWTLT